MRTLYVTIPRLKPAVAPTLAGVYGFTFRIEADSDDPDADGKTFRTRRFGVAFAGPPIIPARGATGPFIAAVEFTDGATATFPVEEGGLYEDPRGFAKVWLYSYTSNGGAGSLTVVVADAPTERLTPLALPAYIDNLIPLPDGSPLGGGQRLDINVQSPGPAYVGVLVQLRRTLNNAAGALTFDLDFYDEGAWAGDNDLARQENLAVAKPIPALAVGSDNRDVATTLVLWAPWANAGVGLHANATPIVAVPWHAPVGATVKLSSSVATTVPVGGYWSALARWFR